MWSPQRSMDNTDKCIQIYELPVHTTSRMIYLFAKDRKCPLPATALPHSDSSVHTYDFNRLSIVSAAITLHIDYYLVDTTGILNYICGLLRKFKGKQEYSQYMTDKVNNVRYICPQVNVFMVSTKTQILNTSLDGNPSVNGYRDGSESCIGFGDDDE